MTTFSFCPITGATSCPTTLLSLLPVCISAPSMHSCLLHKLPTEPGWLLLQLLLLPSPAAASYHLVLLSLWLLVAFICPCPLPFDVNHAVICVWWVVFFVYMCINILSLFNGIWAIPSWQGWCSDIHLCCIHSVFPDSTLFFRYNSSHQWV